MPALKLGISSSERLVAGWVTVVRVRGCRSGKVFDTVVIGALISFANDSYIWCFREAMDGLGRLLAGILVRLRWEGRVTRLESMPPSFWKVLMLPWAWTWTAVGSSRVTSSHCFCVVLVLTLSH